MFYLEEASKIDKNLEMTQINDNNKINKVFIYTYMYVYVCMYISTDTLGIKTVIRNHE